MKINKNKVWALVGQMILAIFIIVCFYAVGFSAPLTQGRGMTPEDIHNAANAARDLGGTSSINYNQIYGLTIAGIVLAFVAIIMPLISMFYENKKVDFALGWATIIFNVAILAVILASISMWANELTTDGHPRYDKGYIAGQFILVFAGAAAAFAGLGVSYKDNLLKF